jgi:hypothetical protein
MIVYNLYKLTEKGGRKMEGVVAVLLIFTLIIVIICFACAIINYIFNGFGLMEMAKAKNEKYPWLSWIPYAKDYLLGKLAYNSNVGGILYLCTTVGVLVICSCISCILGIVGEYNEELTFGFIILYIFIIILGIAYSVFYYITMYKLYKQFSKKAVMMLVFTILTSGSLAPVFIFAIRKNQLQENHVNISNNV